MKAKIKISNIWEFIKTSWFQNDGADGVHPFITLEDVPVIDLTDYQKIIDPTLETVAQEIPSAINEVRNIAIGANKAFVFNTEADMEAWLLIPENVALLITGNLLLIRELTVPDYWWDGTQALELEVKIDLTNYYSKLESDNRYSQLTHRHVGETITPDVINITKTFTQAEIDLLPPNSLFWDDVNQTYAFRTTDGGTIQINQEPHGYYTNLEGAAIVQMNVVSTTGASGNRTAIKLTDATDDLLANACVGMVTVPSIGNNNVGRITKSGGKVNELNTDVVGWVEGDTLYVNPLIKGTLTNVMPVAPNRIIKVGTLLVKHLNVGVIDLQIQVMPKLNELVDGDLTDVSDNDEYLVKEVSTGIWKRFTHSKLITKLNLSYVTVAQTVSQTIGSATNRLTKLFATDIDANKIIITKIVPQADGTSAIVFYKADGTTAVMTINTTNNKVILNEINAVLFSVADNSGNVKYKLDVGGQGGIYNNEIRFWVGGDSLVSAFSNIVIKNLNNGGIRLAPITGLVQIDNGTVGQFRDLILRNLNKTGYDYFAVSATLDTINDTRTSNVSGVKIEEICTAVLVGAANVKGSGTWVITEAKRKIKALTNNVVTNIMDINVAVCTMQNVRLEYSIVSRNATNTKTHFGYMSAILRNEAGAVTFQISHPAQLENDLGIIQDTFTILVGVNKGTLTLVADPAMTTTEFLMYYNVISQGSNSIVLL